MPTLAVDLDTSENVTTSTPPGTNNPDLDPKTLAATVPAVSGPAQAFSICERTFQDNQPRIQQYAQIQSKVDGISPPYNPQTMAEQGKAGLSNIPTGFMQSLVGRVAPRLVLRVKSAPTITASMLPAENDSYMEKTNFYQQTITNTFKTMPRSSVFIQSIAHEVSVYGGGYVAFTDPYSTQPRVYRKDKAFVPEGTEVGQQDVQVFCLQDYYYPNELRDKILDKKSAEDAGWDIDAVVRAINKAAPVAAASPGDMTKARVYQDLIRDVVLGFSWEIGVQVIRVWMLFVTEYDGTVTQYILCRDTGEQLFKANYKDRVMADFVLPWSFQYGNGDYYGSYGIGQMVFELACHLEKIRNKVIDNYNMRAKVWRKVLDMSRLNDSRLLIEDEHVTFVDSEPVGNIAAYPPLTEEFKGLDQYFTQLAQEKVGAFLPEPQVPHARPTATQAKINELKEEETRQFVMDVWLTNWLKFTWMLQRRLCDTKSPDPLAIKTVETLRTMMSDEEIRQITDAPPVQLSVDYSESRKAMRIDFLGKVAASGDPYFNQYEVRRELTTLSLDADSAKSLLIPLPDNTVKIESDRQQQEEVAFMETGMTINVSPRDNHLLSMQYLKGGVDQGTQTLTGALPHAINLASAAVRQGDLKTATASTQTATRLYQHYIQHYDFAVKYNQFQGDGQNQEKQFIAQTGDVLGSLSKAIQSLAQPSQTSTAQPQPAEPIPFQAAQ